MPGTPASLSIRKVAVLPSTLESNTLYFVKNSETNDVTIHITDDAGNVAYQAGSGLSLQDIIDALGTSAVYDVSPVGDAGNDNVVKGDDSRLDQPLSTYRLNLDSMGIYTTTEYKTINGDLRIRSVLSGGTSPEYTTRTETRYQSDGVTVMEVRTWALSYYNGKLLNEVLVP